jgi:glutamyl-tRNA reductase
MSLVVIGLNHRTVPLALLERLTIDEGRLPKALHELTARPHVTEAVVVSTCNRTEVYAYVERFHGAYEDVRDGLSTICHVEPEAFADHLYAFHENDAVRHLFSVAAGLDSAVVGEAEILGQVRRAWDVARTEGTARIMLGGLFRHAIEVGKRVRTETSIARHTTSVSQAAVQMAQARLAGLAGRRVLVLGAGEMGEGMAQSLREAGAADIMVANRTFENANALAARVGGRPVRLHELPTALESVDLLLTSTGATSLIVESSDLKAVMDQRPDHPLLIVDIAVPRDVDPAASDIDGVTLLDMDDLRAFAEVGVRERRREVGTVRELIDLELDRFLAESTARQAAPVVAALHERAETIRAGEYERFRSRLERLEPRDRATVDALVSGLLGKLLHEPTVRIKDAAGSARGERLAEALRELFDLS